MKNLIFAFTLFSVLSFGQITDVSNVIPKCTEVGKTNFTTLERCTDGSVRIRYRDMKFQQLVEYKKFSFKDDGGAYDLLYSRLVSGFDELPEGRITLDLPDDVIFIEYTKSMGMTNVRFAQAVNKTDVFGFSQWFTKKQIDKLFGK